MSALCIYMYLLVYICIHMYLLVPLHFLGQFQLICHCWSFLVFCHSMILYGPLKLSSLNSLSFENKLPRNSWSWLPSVGSSSSFYPFGTNFSATHRVRKSLWDLYLVAFSFNRLSFNAVCSLLMFL